MRRSFREKTRYRNSLKSLQIKETFRLYDFWKGNFDLNGGIPYGYIESKYLPRLFGYSTNLASSAEELLSISQMTFFCWFWFYNLVFLNTLHFFHKNKLWLVEKKFKSSLQSSLKFKCRYKLFHKSS